ncbi:hypothetical protein [Streptomyces sp. HJ7]
MAFRKTVPLDELREQRDRAGHDDSGDATTYQSSRGGWYPQADKPVPGAGTGARKGGGA